MAIKMSNEVMRKILEGNSFSEGVSYNCIKIACQSNGKTRIEFLLDGVEMFYVDSPDWMQPSGIRIDVSGRLPISLEAA